MREYVVTLRSGHRVTVKAARVVVQSHENLVMLADDGPTIADPNPAANAVALFARDMVVSVVARDHLVGEEKVAPAHVVGGGPNDDIPF